MALAFNQRVKHGRLDFHPGVVYAFEDPDAAPYFIACGWAAETDDEATVTITLGELDIDPLTIVNDMGSERHLRFVMPDRAAETLGISVEQAAAMIATRAVEDSTNG